MRPESIFYQNKDYLVNNNFNFSQKNYYYYNFFCDGLSEEMSGRHLQIKKLLSQV